MCRGRVRVFAIDLNPELVRTNSRRVTRRDTVAVGSTHNRRTRKFLKDLREAVSDRGGGVRSRGERASARGAPKARRSSEMQYLVAVIFDQAGLATPDEMAAIDVFNDRLIAEGQWVFAGGL